MRIREQDFFHGAALTRIVEHQSFKALNKADERYGHYLINADTRIFVKYRSNEESPWQFNFTATELEGIREDLVAGARVFLCLVCGETTICALDSEEITTLLDINSTVQQRISVEVRQVRGSMWLSGSLGNLDRSIPHNAFPNKLFQSL
ncbi:hypothetical protein CIG75_00600 [Tumebacillus algifaecis]|uniref:Uncharacterized protein n=1 Tax=Tumebacillus algifaecis TaxID=1214604 RepID=A0A223CWC1_9BACL|nr:hypothetical protein CIG75_00600 [Tumebacillus algifaecis]